MDEFNISLSQAQKIIDTRKIIQNERIISDKSAVVKGEIDVVVFKAQSRGLKPIFIAKDFALFDKPSGVMVHPRNRLSGYTLIDEAKHYFGDEANITHRIDKETSGIVLVSKNKRSERVLKGLFEKREISKSYLALVKGRLTKELTIDEPILKNSDYSDIKLKVFIDSRGKRAKTLVRPIKIIGKNTLIEAIPLTGRQHQIRIHMFHVKHPIVGDPIYGVDVKTAAKYLDKTILEKERVKKTGAKRLMLHANYLSFKYKKSYYKLFSKYDFEKECKKL
jgi:23S rRNA pseudouridine1911/1915/1917 synthase